MLTISHRGYCKEATENTLEAFDHAAKLGVDGIETDIRLTTDGSLVLFHDRRMADGQEVCDLTYSELCDMAGYSVPALEDALEWSDQHLWILELKDSEAIEECIRVLKQYVPLRRLLVTSFWHNAVAEVQRQLAVECAVSMAHRPTDFQTSHLRRWHTLIWQYEFIDKDLIQEAIANGHRNMVYDVDGIDEHRKCYEMGVDGIITDQPLFAAAGKPPTTIDDISSA